MSCESYDALGKGETVGYAFIVIALLCTSGMMAGLTLGLLSLDRLDLQVLKRVGTKSERKWADKVLPVIRSENFLMVTLVTINSGAASALPIFMHKLVPEYVAIILSTTAILIFGEILPQAACSRYGVTIGGFLSPLVRALMMLLSPISYPLGKLLDWMLGRKGDLLHRGQLSALVDVHRAGSGLGGDLTVDEANVIRGALEMTVKTAADVMTPLSQAFMVSADARLDGATRQAIMAAGHSRVPVYRGTNRQDIIGVLLTKELLRYWGGAATGVLVRDVVLRPLPALPASLPLYDVLNIFQTGRSHMALLVEPTTSPADGAAAAAASGQQQQQDSPAAAAEPAQGTAGSTDSAAGSSAAAAPAQAAPTDNSTSPAQRKAVMFNADSSSAPAAASEVTIAPKPLRRSSSMTAARQQRAACSGAAPLGLLTLEDIIEELMQEEILDEMDLRNSQQAAVHGSPAQQQQGLRVNLPLVARALPAGQRKLIAAAAANAAAMHFAGSEGHLGAALAAAGGGGGEVGVGQGASNFVAGSSAQDASRV